MLEIYLRICKTVILNHFSVKRGTKVSFGHLRLVVKVFLTTWGQIQSSATITLSNITWYGISHIIAGNETEYQSEAEPTKVTPFFALTDELAL